VHQLGGLTDLGPGVGDHVEQAARVVGVEATTGEPQPLGEARPLPLVRRRSELGEHVVHVAAEVLVRDVAAAVTDQQPVLRQQTLDGEGVEGRQHHPLGQVTRRAEQDENGGPGSVRRHDPIVPHGRGLTRNVT
jgi:hypothetical protein